ncbi:NXPE family member 3-like [Acanthopagrus latus]|uniref:NXPE family member 3-like n=1 Tax=Acanthopagrus latus TaxID=8177 RepID=UPI00187C513D|nr:NXPE family member 3-like [Acanthopagrus latus]
MKVRACLKARVNYTAIFLFLTMAVFVFVLHNIETLEVWYKVNFTTGLLKPATDHHRRHGFCTFEPLSPEDAEEERLLLESTAWPKTPVLPSPLSLEETSDPAHSTFTILPGKDGRQWQIGDQLEVTIKMRDFKGRPKNTGGDVLLARLHNPSLEAGVAGKVVDHLDGTYTAVFSLLWEGSAQVQVTLVHPSEAVTVLRRLSVEEPDRIYFKSVFRSGNLSQTTTCNICLRPTQQPQCNYTDVRTGEPWFCYKPQNLSCKARITHFRAGLRRSLKAKEGKLFQRRVNMKVPIRASEPADITVLPKKEGQLNVESSIVKSGPAGYYYQGVWHALGGSTVHQFNIEAITQCLKGKVIYMFGDSTVRQFFEYLTAELPNLKEFDLHSQRKAGPFISLDYTNNILMKYRFHGPPIRTVPVPISELRYMASELNGVTGGSNTVVIFCVWAHFGTFPMELYIRRLQTIRRAVVQLLDRAPDTLVIIRTGNPKELTFTAAQTNSDWQTYQVNKVLRAMFKGLNVHFVNAWEMTLAHHLPHDLHPKPPIIKNMINVIMSYMCPQQGG